MSATPQHLGKYELRQQLGRGGVGDVWKAYDLQLHRDIAVKVLHTDLQSDPHFLTRFTREGQKIADLHHTNIVQIHEVNIARSPQSHETTAYIAMEYIAGQTLENYLHDTARRGAYPPLSQIIYLFTCLGAAIDYAHQKNIVHGNIKPSNILLNMNDTGQFETGEPMLTDFGLPLLLGPNANISSPLYMAPEQARGMPAVGRSDIYSLGVMLYEICTGVRPFRDESSVAVMMQHINTLPTPPILINPNVPLALSEVILHALTKDATSRVASATDLARAVADACAGQNTIQGPLQVRPETTSLLNGPPRARGSLLGVSQPLANDMPPNQNSQPLPQQVSQPLPGLQSESQALVERLSQRLPIVRDSLSERLSQPLPKVSQPLPKLPPPSQQTPGQISRPLPPLPETIEEPPTQIQPTFSTPPQLPAPLSIPTPAILQPPKKPASVPLNIVMVGLFLLLLLVGSTIVAILLRNGGSTPPATAASNQAFFLDDAQGINDQIRIEIQGLAPAPSGKNYFAWLNTASNQARALGALNVQGDKATLLYQGDDKHTNLLSIIQGISITLENTGSAPPAPTGKVVYSGSFNPDTLAQLKNILYTTPEIPNNQSVAKGLLETVKSMNDKAGSIVDTLQGSHDYLLARRQATRIIEMLDSTAYAKSGGDLPADLPSQLNVPVGLISVPDHQGYLDILAQYISQLKQTAGNNPRVLAHAQNVENAIGDLKDWLQKVRQDTVQILKAPDLADPGILNTALELKQLVAEAYTGRTTPPNQSPQPTQGSAGALQGYIEAQYTAALDLQLASN